MSGLTRLVRELRRRHLFRILGTYVVGGWGLLQVADLAFASLDLPGRTLGYVWMALLVGLPAALVFGWRYDLTGDGIVRTPPATADDPGDLALRSPDYVILLALAAVMALIGYELLTTVSEIRPDPPVAAQPEAPPHSLAVLPFVNMSADPEQEFFSDGLSEELLNGLAQVKGLRVAGRTSSFHFKGVNEDLRTIGEKLSVRHLLEGSVRKAGNRIRVTAQLINAADGYHLWSDTYDYEVEDVFRIQDEISLAVVNAMQVTLLGRDRERLARRRPVNFEAQKLYLEGRQHMHDRTQESLERARELFELSVREDPAYALAYSGLSDANMLLAQNHGVIHMGEALARTRPLIERALALDDQSAEVWTSQGLIEISDMNGSQARARDALERAIELNPSYADAYFWYADVLEPEQGIEVLEKVLAMDPLNRPARGEIANRLKRLGRIDEAVAQATKGVVLDPDYDAMYQMLFILHTNYTYRHDEALFWVEKGHEIWPEEVLHMMSMVFAYHTLGMEEQEESWAVYLRDNHADHMFVAALPAIRALYRQDAEESLKETLGIEATGALRHNRTVRRIVGKMIVWAYVLTDRPDDGLAFLRDYTPEVFGPDPEVVPWASQLAAFLLMRTGQRDEAAPVLDSLREHAGSKMAVDRPYGEIVLAKVALYESDYEGFIEHANLAVDAGWLQPWGEGWTLDEHPPARPWTGRPEFDRLVERLASRTAEQRATVEEHLLERELAATAGE